VVSREVAQRLREYLRLAAADSGTGKRSQVRGGVLGKTGTAKLVVNRVYTNRYAASFAGIYPAKDPQLVVVVRIEDPKSDEYYGGLVAAPITARMLRQALAVRNSPIDRSRLDDGVVVTERSRPAEQVGRPPAVSVPWPLEQPDDGPADPVLVPDVVGKSVREAAFALHRRGFRVRLDGSGRVVSTKPEGGASLALGRTVTVVGRRSAP
jgi:cell division protein FtsI (penicillin-binding protein 3)